MVYKGALDPIVVFEAICNSFEDIPEEICNTQPTVWQEVQAILVLFTMFCMVVSLNLVFLYIGHWMRKTVIE